MPNNIVVIGSANTDLITHVDRLPKPGETVLGGTFMTAQGGKGANQAVAASRAGADVTFIACLGRDNFADEAIKSYRQDKIDISHLFYDDNNPSGVALIFVAKNGENSIAVASGANAGLSPQQIEEKQAVISQADVLLLQLETPLETVTRAVEIAKQYQVEVILNPAPGQVLPDSLLRSITYLTPNETEAELMTGISISNEKQAFKAAQMLLAKGATNVILTLGKNGALLANASGETIIPCKEVDVIDTTAAGDTFNGAFAVALAQRAALTDAICFANAAAALSVTRQGAQPSIPDREAIGEMLR